MRIGRNSYTGYSIGCAVVWAVILAVASVMAPPPKRREIQVVFGGWVIGWTSATIARWVYPPPKRQPRWRPAAQGSERQS